MQATTASVIRYNVPSSTEDLAYRVLVSEDRSLAFCPCKGFSYRGICGHVKDVLAGLAEGYRVRPLMMAHAEQVRPLPQAQPVPARVPARKETAQERYAARTGGRNLDSDVDSLYG